MKNEDDIINKVGHDTGMRVPDGYFDSFAHDMMAKLPEYPQKPMPQRLSTWNRIKPYIYLAAMFAGIWCMMKMFHIASQGVGPDQEEIPASVITAMQDQDTYEYFYQIDDDDTYDFKVEESVISDYDNISDFEKDFGYVIEPEYASIKLPARLDS